MGVCVPNFRSVSFFVWPGDMTHINTYTNIRVNLRISSTGCSPHADFDLHRRFEFGIQVLKIVVIENDRLTVLKK